MSDENQVEWQGHKISADLQKTIQDTVNKAKQAGQYEAFDTVKADMKMKAPELFADIDTQKTKLADMMTEFEKRMKSLNETVDPERKKAKEETPDMVKSRLESEYKNRTETELKKIRIQSAVGEAKAAAIAAKLDEQYADVFDALMLKHYPADINGDTVVFRDGDLILHNAESKPARPSDVAAMILKKYPKLINNPTPGPSLGGRPQNQPTSAVVNSSSKIASGLSEVFKTA